jgi:hypothetical protein
MAETRKQLTDVQAKYLANSQETLNKARGAYEEAEKNAQQVLLLIFDALGLSSETAVRFDEVTKELVIETPPAPKPGVAA